jgi:hypothetical protein
MPSTDIAKLEVYDEFQSIWEILFIFLCRTLRIYYPYPDAQDFCTVIYGDFHRRIPPTAGLSE